MDNAGEPGIPIELLPPEPQVNGQQTHPTDDKPLAWRELSTQQRLQQGQGGEIHTQMQTIQVHEVAAHPAPPLPDKDSLPRKTPHLIAPQELQQGQQQETGQQWATEQIDPVF